MLNYGEEIFAVLKKVTGTAATLSILLLTACGTPPMTAGGAPHLTALYVAPETSSIALGQTVQLKATGVFSDGSSKDVTQSAVWTISNPSIASVDSSGLATSLSTGTANVVAASGGHSSSSVLTISKAALLSIAVSPSDLSVVLGNDMQLTATGTFTDKSTQDLTNLVTWASSQPGVAIVSSSGLAVSRSVGTSAITATLDSVNASTPLTVSSAGLVSIAVNENHATIPLGTTAQFTAKGVYTDGSTQDLTNTVTWTSTPSGILSISSSGLAKGKTIGAATVSAKSGSVSGTGGLTVSSAGLVSIAVNENHATIPLGTTAQFTAKGVYTDGSTQDLTNTVTWTSTPSGILSISSSGLAKGKTIGVATVSAKSGSVSGTGGLTVSSAGLVSIAVNENHATIPLGTTAQFTAKGVYTDGSTQDLTNTVTWTSTPSGILSISSSGLAKGKTIGAATVSAKSGSVSGTGALTVSPAVLTSIGVVAALQAMPLGTRQQLNAIGTYTDGSTGDLTASAAWSSESADIVSISPSGLAAANKLGSATVSASFTGISGSAALAVSSATLASISISPANPTMPLGSSRQLAATGLYTDGSTHDVTQSVTWNVDNPAIANVSGTGVATAQQVGASGVESSLGDVVGSVTLTVQPLAAIGYFTQTTPDADAAIRITNTGSTGQNLCAMVYVFDQDQQMAECCGCLISPDGLRTFSLQKDFLSNPLTGTSPVAGSVMIVPADPSSNPSCNAASITPWGLAVAWTTHLQNAQTNQPATTEEPLSFTPLSSTLSSALQAQCNFVQQLGSGHGICGCGTGD